MITAVFEGWRREGIDFLVLRNYEQLPAFTTNDIDVLVRPGQRENAARHLVAAAARHGFALLNRAEFATLALYFGDPETGAQVHFDLFTCLQWRGLDFIDCSGFLDRRIRRGLFDVPGRADEAVTNLLAYLIYAGKVKEKYRASIQSGFAADPAGAVALLGGTYGAARASWLVEQCRTGGWDAVGKSVGELRKLLLRRSLLRKPIRTIWSLATNLLRLGRRLLAPPGVVVVLCGADGCGKTTAGKLLVEMLGGTFSPDKGRQFHWKPPVFSGRRRAARGAVTAPHAQPLRGLAGSMIFFAVHWLEFVFGAPLKLLPITFRGGLVLIDRHYYDFFVDQRRYRLRLPMSVVRAGYALLPKPDLVLVLDAPTAVLRSRKQEVSEEETARQREAYARLGDLPGIVRIMDATQSPVAVAQSMQRELFRFMAERNKKRCGM